MSSDPFPANRLALVSWVVGVAVGGALALGVAPGILTGTSTTGTGCGPCGPPFSIGNPVGPSVCHLPLAVGCVAPGEYRYTLTIEEGSGVQFSHMVYAVHAMNGSPYVARSGGGFTYESSTGTVVAEFLLVQGGNLSVPSGSDWTFFTAQTGVSGATALSSAFSLVVDTGSVDPAGLGLSVSAVGTGTSRGVNSTVGLP